jgi:hypothetical protein
MMPPAGVRGMKNKTLQSKDSGAASKKQFVADSETNRRFDCSAVRRRHG